MIKKGYQGHRFFFYKRRGVSSKTKVFSCSFCGVFFERDIKKRMDVLLRDIALLAKVAVERDQCPVTSSPTEESYTSSQQNIATTPANVSHHPMHDLPTDKLRKEFEASQSLVQTQQAELYELRQGNIVLQRKCAQFAARLEQSESKNAHLKANKVDDATALLLLGDRVQHLNREVVQWKVDVATWAEQRQHVGSELEGLRRTVKQVVERCSHWMGECTALQSKLSCADENLLLLHQSRVSLASLTKERDSLQYAFESMRGAVEELRLCITVEMEERDRDATAQYTALRGVNDHLHVQVQDMEELLMNRMRFLTLPTIVFASGGVEEDFSVTVKEKDWEEEKTTSTVVPAELELQLGLERQEKIDAQTALASLRQVVCSKMDDMCAAYRCNLEARCPEGFLQNAAASIQKAFQLDNEEQTKEVSRLQEALDSLLQESSALQQYASTLEAELIQCHGAAANGNNKVQRDGAFPANNRGTGEHSLCFVCNRPVQGNQPSAQCSLCPRKCHGACCGRGGKRIRCSLH